MKIWERGRTEREKWDEQESGRHIKTLMNTDVRSQSSINMLVAIKPRKLRRHLTTSNDTRQTIFITVLPK